MNKETENYIILKPISERFNEVSKNITDDEIKSLIFSVLRDKINEINFTYDINNIIKEYIDNHNEDIIEIFSKGLKDRLKYK